MKTNEPTAMTKLFWQMVDDFRDMGEKLATAKRENDEIKKELDNWKQYAEDLTKELDETKMHLNNYKFISQSLSNYNDKKLAQLNELLSYTLDTLEDLTDDICKHVGKYVDDDPDWMD